MKKILLFLFLTFSLFAACAQTKRVTRLGIAHPTTGNLRNVLNLIEKNHIRADSIRIVGIFHQKQTDLIESSQKMIADNNLQNVQLFVIQGEISLDDLFTENLCSKEFRKIFDETDAMIFFGGDDIPPVIYGEETFLTTELISSGKNWELSFMFHLIGGFRNEKFVPMLEKKPDYPVLGICLGMQEMNVAAGGSLYQDIPFQIYGKTTYESILKENAENIHKNYWNRVSNENDCSFIHLHPIRVAKGSFLDFPAFSGNPVVASVHHQSANKIGKNFKVVATSMDGKVVEALQHTRYKNVYGIQFHTDFSVLYEDGKVFDFSPSQKSPLSEETKRFQKLFWGDFSERLK